MGLRPYDRKGAAGPVRIAGEPGLLSRSAPGEWSRWLPVAAWAAVIWVFSTDLFSGTGTGSVFRSLIYGWFPDAEEPTVELLHGLLRKAAHLTEYAILAILTVRGFDDSRRGRGWIALLTMVLCVAYAASDEFHQSFVPSRTGAASDVFVDAVGAAIGVGLSLTMRLSGGRRSRA